MNTKTFSGENELYDGPFKVPLPRRKHADCNMRSSSGMKIKAPKPLYKQIDQKYRNELYQKLLVKLLQFPETITRYDMKVLSTHPVIKQLLKQSKENSMTNTSFYIPIDSLLNPDLYSTSNIPIIFESHGNASNSTKSDKNCQEEIHEEVFADDSTSSNPDCELIEEKRVGKYTLKERNERIAKYKLKLSRHKQGKSLKQTNKKTRKYNKLQPRKNGRFSSYNSVDDDFTGLLKKETTSASISCSKQYLDTSDAPSSSTLNDLVSEITGIY